MLNHDVIPINILLLLSYECVVYFPSVMGTCIHHRMHWSQQNSNFGLISYIIFSLSLGSNSFQFGLLIVGLLSDQTLPNSSLPGWKDNFHSKILSASALGQCSIINNAIFVQNNSQTDMIWNRRGHKIIISFLSN